jgi:hypothetical protein
MKLLKDLLLINQKKITEAPVDDHIDNDGDPHEEKDMNSLVEKWMDVNKVHRFEGMSGVRNFTKLIDVLGYKDIDYFLEDNPDAMNAMVEFISSSHQPEWIEHMQNAVSEE